MIDSTLKYYALFDSKNLNHSFLPIKVNSKLRDSIGVMLQFMYSDTSYFTISGHMQPTLDTIKSIRFEHFGKALYLEATALDGRLQICDGESRQTKSLGLMLLIYHWIDEWFKV